MVPNDMHKTRKEREEAFRRQLVLDAAEELFAKNGFDRTKVADIAKRAELAKGSLYQLFTSKEEIITALVDRTMDNVFNNISDILDSNKSPVEKIHYIIQQKIGTLWKSRHFARIFLHELRGFSSTLESSMITDHYRRMKTLMNRVEDVIRQGQDSGDFRNDIPASLIAAALGGFSNAVIYCWLEEESGEKGDINMEDAIGKVENLFIDGIGVKK